MILYLAVWYDRQPNSETQQSHGKELADHNLNQMSGMDTQSLVVRVQFQNKMKFLELKEIDLNWKTFIDKGNSQTQIYVFSEFHFTLFTTALTLFDAKIHGQKAVYLKDNLGTDIPQNLFEQILRNFHNGSNFFVQMSVDSLPENQIGLVTPSVSVNFICCIVLPHNCAATSNAQLLIYLSFWKHISKR